MQTKATIYLAFIAMLLGSGCSKDSQPHSIGEAFGGGIVFDVSADGIHGLIAAPGNQGASNWYDAPSIAQIGYHGEAGEAFTDWRLPTRDELDKLYHKKDIVGGFYLSGIYWSSEEYDDDNAWGQDMGNKLASGVQFYKSKTVIGQVRSVREF